MTKDGETSEVKHFEESIRALEIVLSMQKDITCVVNADTHKIIYANESMKKVFSINNSIIEEDFCKVIGESKDILSIMLQKHNNNEESSDEKYYDNISRWFKRYFMVTKWVDGSSVFIITMTDITELKKQEMKVMYMKYYDKVLDIQNRFKFALDMEGHLNNDTTGAVVYFDIDNFKNINDAYGYHSGDYLLKLVCEFLQTLCPKDNIYRFGGDEFAVILNSDAEDVIQEFSEKLLSRFRLPWDFGEFSKYFTASIGVTRFPKDAVTVEEIIKNADIAMFRAKHNGKDSVFYFQNELNIDFNKRVKIEECLRQAINDKCREFELHYQPIVNIVTNQCVGAEALIRWYSRELGLVRPDEFVPIAEQFGLMIPIGEWVLEEACKKCKEWQRELNIAFKMHINVSNKQLQTPGFVNSVRKAIEKMGISANSIILEITEISDYRDAGAIHSVLIELKKIGVAIAMDDFGTGYSSLGNIMNTSIDIIKIDKTLAENIESDSRQATFIKSITNLSQVLHKRVFIEGVETLGQLEVLRDMGNVSIVQGYYYSRPLDERVFTNWYKKIRQQL